MSWATTAQSTILALVAGVKARPALAGVLITNGQQVSDSAVSEGITFAYQDQQSPVIVGIFAGSEDYETDQSRERYTINCAITVETGDADYLTYRDRAFALFDEVGAFLALNPNLSGAVLSARLSTWQLWEPVGAATIITLMFGVDVDAFTIV
jgi:hypothetical protein